MTQTVLRIDSSLSGDASRSRVATAQITQNQQPERVIHRDLATDPLPFIDADWAAARLVPEADRTEAQKDALALSDTLISEMRDADTLVIALPVHNFGMPASLKAWVDLIARPGVTFRYTENGPIGLFEGKKAIIVYASGGTPLGASYDYASGHLRQVLNFVGIKDVQIVDTKEQAVAA